MEGLIIKGIGGFYYVKTADGVYQTRGRGIFKKDGVTLMVGDNVDMEVLPDGDGVINAILPRRNQFIRPPIANVDCFIVVLAAAKPKPNFSVIDKFLVMAEQNDMDCLLYTSSLPDSCFRTGRWSGWIWIQRKTPGRYPASSAPFPKGSRIS